MAAVLGKELEQELMIAVLKFRSTFTGRAEFWERG
jgi:hypothetical protein